MNQFDPVKFLGSVLGILKIGEPPFVYLLMIFLAKTLGLQENDKPKGVRICLLQADANF